MIKLQEINKSFSSIQVLKDISIDFHPGEVHVLLGENGAGKSTLMKILSGIYHPDSGYICLNNKKFEQLSPKQSIAEGICIIHQELSVVDELSVQENIFMGVLPNKLGVVNYQKLGDDVSSLLDKLKLNISPIEIVKNLKIAEKQMVEIAKVLALDADIIIMDEPTTSLTSQEIDSLFDVINILRERGKYIIYISHRLEEIKAIGDRVTVLRDGKHIVTESLDRSTDQDLSLQITGLVTKMVGRELTNEKLLSQYTNKNTDEYCLEISDWTRKDKKNKNISLTIKKGDIFGLAGLVGSGRTEFVESIFGLYPKETGKITLFTKVMNIKTPYEALKQGIALLSENRRESGIFQNFTVSQNINLINSIKSSKLKGLVGSINHTAENDLATHFQKVMNIKCAGINQNITQLSGGNQQKVLVSRWLAAKSNFFIFDEPTKGIDVGSKQEIYQIMRQLADDGIGVLIVSSDLPELLTICDQIGVFKDGAIQGILQNNSELQEKDIMELALT